MGISLQTDMLGKLSFQPCKFISLCGSILSQCHKIQKLKSKQ